LLRINSEFAANLPAQKIRAPTLFWTIADVIRNASCEPITDEVEAIDALHHRLSETVRLQSIFEEAGFDESPYAAAAAEHLVTDHHALLVTSWGSRIWNKVGWIPPEQRQWLSAAVHVVSISAWDALGGCWEKIVWLIEFTNSLADGSVREI
jgi:hypothetical protein